MLAAMAFGAGASQAQTITTSPITTLPVAATPVPFGQPLTWLLLTLVLFAGAMWLLKRMNVSMGTLRQIALGSCVLVLSTTALWGDAVFAQLQWIQRQFTEPAGETLDVPLQAVESAGVVTGFVPVEFTNVTHQPLRVKSITMPAWTACFPAGVPSSPVASASTPASAPCAVGRQVAAGKACWVDTAALCTAAAVALKGTSPSVLIPDTAAVNEGGSTGGNVLANDADADGPLLVASYVFGGVRHLAGQAASANGLGDISLQADGEYRFQAAKPFAAASTRITYTTHTGATADLTVTVNRAPVAVDDSLSVAEGSPTNVPVLDNDFDPDGDALTIASYTQGTHGQVGLDGAGKLTYTPSANYRGSDIFSYVVSDAGGLTATANVLISVISTNNAPQATDLILSTNQNVPLNGALSATDADGDTLTFAVIGAPAHGSLILDPATGRFTYTPSQGHVGTDNFTCMVSDGHGGTAYATVHITVNAANRAPQAQPDAVTIRENESVAIAVRSNDMDPDGDVLTVIDMTQGMHGSVAVDPVTGNLIYTPNPGFSGIDYFTYTISDGEFSSMAMVTVTVTANPAMGICGNGVIEVAEQCDDGNTVNGDGCSATCATETLPAAVCGNGVKEAGEQCDDGNTVNGDDCSATCTLENAKTLAIDPQALAQAVNLPWRNKWSRIHLPSSQ